MAQDARHTSDTSRNPKCRWYQFSLRTLFIVTALAVVLFSLLAGWSHNARQQQSAVSALMQTRGLLHYDFVDVGSDGPCYIPKWLVNAIGVEYFGTVVGADFSFTLMTDVRLKPIENLTQLRSLSLMGTLVTDAGLEHLKGLTLLQGLNLMQTQVTDAGLVHLKGLAALQSLNLADTQVTDAGLEHLKDLTVLQGINLEMTQVTDAGLVHLQGLTSLKSLRLSDTKVTAAGVARLQKLLPNCMIAHGPR
ncbi:MAG: hypothetical protein K8T25_06725 [Planctomycetia bacterium]|nr:hypothetical protein [Planctomycetia bacterium]